MSGDPAWVDVASVVTALFSTLTAIVALVVAIRSDRRSREALQVQTYMELRAGFLDIFRELGALDEDPDADEIEVRLARTAYWHHAWDEWYVAKGLAPQEFSGLWDDFFAKQWCPATGIPRCAWYWRTWRGRTTRVSVPTLKS